MWMHFELNGRCQNPSDQTCRVNIFKVQYLFMVLLSLLRSNLYTIKCINLQFTVWCVLTNTSHLPWLHRLGTQFRVQCGSLDLGAQWLPLWSGHKAVLPLTSRPHSHLNYTLSLSLLLFASSVLSTCFSTSAVGHLCVCAMIRFVMKESDWFS